MRCTGQDGCCVIGAISRSKPWAVFSAIESRQPQQGEPPKDLRAAVADPHELGRSPENEPTRKRRCCDQLWRLNFAKAFEKAVTDFMTKLETDGKLR
jgi:hypothetical protein